MRVLAHLLYWIFHDQAVIDKPVVKEQIWVLQEADGLVTDKHADFYFLRLATQFTDLNESANLVFELHVHPGPLLIAEAVWREVAVVADEDPVLCIDERWVKLDVVGTNGLQAYLLLNLENDGVFYHFIQSFFFWAIFYATALHF